MALISDLHVGPVREESFTRRVVNEVNAQHPDLVVLAGDLIDGRVEQVGAATDPLRDLRAPLGVVAVSGNHEVLSQEADAWLEHYASLGITVLRNSNVKLTRGGASIAVAGSNDETASGADSPNIGTTLAGVNPDAFTLLVTHQPKAAESAGGRGVDLQVSGHTHGGQLWPFRYVVTLQQPTLDGLALVGDVPPGGAPSGVALWARHRCAAAASTGSDSTYPTTTSTRCSPHSPSAPSPIRLRPYAKCSACCDPAAPCTFSSTAPHRMPGCAVGSAVSSRCRSGCSTGAT